MRERIYRHTNICVYFFDTKDFLWQVQSDKTFFLLRVFYGNQKIWIENAHYIHL